MRNSWTLPVLLLAATPAAAHVMLLEPAAKPGASYMAHFNVGHGCSGSPTIALSITLPAAIAHAVPQPKPGWQVKQAGNVISFSGGRLAADKADSFDILMRLPAQAQTLAFPTLQTCETGTVNWDQTAGPGNAPTHPAPHLAVGVSEAMPDMAGMHHM